MRGRLVLNLAALAVVFGGGDLLSAQRSVQPSPNPGLGACCGAVGYVCHTNLDGIVIVHPDSRPC
ncbi:hypothetical protein [Longimicrobium sp.]|uniref:hypothetical protein n=1 Tax=Longimicrobium sp. TaxID=2029185 RepID=UPI002E376399|nr:hypothetical protein [Longimicrobium sp.]HEX6040588.1 hypothetical protein [Longimicrobium sp.]